MSARRITLLGPQPQYESLKVALESHQIHRRVALVTAGWETDESQDHQLKDSIQAECINLKLFERTEGLFADDVELIQRLQARQDELRHLRNAYNERLDLLLKAARQIIRRPDELIELDAERESAIEMVRQLDRQYFVRTSQIIDRYEQELQIPHRPLVAGHRRELAHLLDSVEALLISGGHVAIILNRLKIFGVLEMRPELPIIAWSGGAMALAEQVVFFHDSPPQGGGNAEVLRAGMGLFHDILPLPDANNRLDLNDQCRVELFARRFNQFSCMLFDDQTILEYDHGHWSPVGDQPPTCLGDQGRIVSFSA